jgi:hypothetical protein
MDRLEKARGHQLELVLPSLQQEILDQCEGLRLAMIVARDSMTCSAPAVAAIGAFMEEVQQIEEDFDQVSIDWKKKIVIATTEPITLRDVYLGPFAIHFCWERLLHQADVACFDVVALEPRPPVANGHVTHPHVKDRSLCAGDASVPIRKALDQGRLADAFCLISGVWKLQYSCHTGDTEVGGFGISSEQDLLYIEDFITVRQETTAISVRFLDNAVADFFDACVDRGLTPQQFSRVWCHTHPGDLATPSSLDEATFARCFGRCDWSLMFIVARSGKTYARLSFAAGPGGQIVVPTVVDWPAWPDSLHQRSDALETLLAQWEHEYAENVVSLPASLQDTMRMSDLECGWQDH